ncbi:galactose-1-phosphate uridylyltransferase [bacterium]|nr:galactose-1-phosphate uridylyltransferase [bacterium]
MTMLRQDPLTGRWVIFAADRSRRPNEYPLRQRDTSGADRCPFCPGHESETTPEILALGRPAGASADGPGWRMRVFRNMFPALVPADAPPDAATGPLLGGRPAAGRAGIGHHEVVAYSPDHAAAPHTLAPGAWTELLGVLRDRSRVFARHPDVRYVSPFCNHGPEAGATLVHPHMQIIGAPEVPLLAVGKAEGFARHRAAHGTCLLCELATAEERDGARLVGANAAWLAMAPWASRFPWELLFVPRRHGASLNQATDSELVGLGTLLVPALRGLAKRHGDCSLNIVIHSAAVDAAGEDEGDGAYHWHLEVLPRLSRPAGFEVGTGYTINAVRPEDVAAALRSDGKNP